jgi:Zn-dependent protease with chaperone function
MDRTDAAARAQRRRAVILSLAAVLSLLLVALYGIPEIANQLSRLVPPQFEQYLGRAADARIRVTLDKGPKGRPFECGASPGEAEGKVVFDRLMTRLAQAGGLAMPIQPAVIRREEANAFALAGGHVYVLQGLIENAKDVDEVAAIIAHELGHIAHRDGTRSIMQSAGLSLVFGMLLGDFVGGAAVVVAAQLLLKASYSRRQESAADDFSVRTLQELDVNPRALATFLDRVARTPRGWSIFFAHPSVPERVARINAMALPESGRKPLLTDAEWQALKRICAGYR